MTKGEQTREMILARAAQLFSRQGYFGSSYADIMHETGMKKGGLYNHFTSKDELALEAFDYAWGLLETRMKQSLSGKTNTIDRLLAIVAHFKDIVDNPVLDGGCPVLNTAIEADDAHPALRQKALAAMDSWFELIQRTVSKGIARGEIRPEVDGQALATLMISSLEGAMMLYKLYRHPHYMYQAAAHLTHYIETTIRI